MIKLGSLVIPFLLALPPPLIHGETIDMVHQSICYDKDDVPVDVDALYDENCVDVYGNMYGLDSELYSCCDCFRYVCEKIEYWGKQMKVGWVRSVSDQCCQNCNGTVYPTNTIISTTNLEDDCLTIKTEICRVRPGLKTAAIEQEFSYRNCCNDNNKTLQYLGAEVPDPSTCSIMTCEYDPAWPHSVWITEKELEGCDCCLLPNGTLVPDGATWWDFSVKPAQLRECCRGQIVTPDTSETPPGSECKLDNFVLKGDSYEWIKDVPTWFECHEYCTHDKNCASFTLRPSNSCVLNSDVPYDNSGFLEGASAGIKGCPFKDCQLDNTYLKGNIIEEVEDIHSWYECQQLCAFNLECKSFTWNYWPYVCYLLSDNPEYIGTFEGAISGIKNCWDPSNCGVSMDGPLTEITRTKYRYEWLPWTRSSQFIVDVKGDRDANIMFCYCDGCDGYRVLIGGWANQKSFIRDNENDENLQTLVDTPDILSTTEYRRFIIDLILTPTEFTIEVRKGGECFSFLQRSWGIDEMPWPLANYIAFSGYTDNPMDFRFLTSVSWNGNCVRDSSYPYRLLPTNAVPGFDLGGPFPSNTPARCIEACHDQGFEFAGVQTGHECWCGNDAPPEDRIVDMAECDVSCSGDSSQICGGVWRMNVYKITRSDSDCGIYCPDKCPNYNVQCSNATNLQVGGSRVYTTPAQCGRNCQTYPACNAWTMIPKDPTPPNATCYFLSNCDNKEDFEGRISGYFTCPNIPGGVLSDSCPVYDKSCIARDNVVAPTDGIIVTTPDQCGEACFTNPRCIYWTMDPEFLPPADCYVLSSCEDAVPKNRSVSGSNRCP